MLKTHSALVFSIISAVAYYLYVTALAQKKASFAQRLGIILAAVIGLIALALAIKFAYCTIGCYFFGGCPYNR